MYLESSALLQVRALTSLEALTLAVLLKLKLPLPELDSPEGDLRIMPVQEPKGTRHLWEYGG